ncbi:MAG: helix-turn-helix domain-containing protein [Elusimicrobiota bacterium]
MTEIKDVMSIIELSAYLGIGKSKIYSLIRQKKIPASRIGRQYRFSKTVIDEWLKEKIITRKETLQMNFFNSENKE